jgi:EAL and modified HD-GYP domain-containing signal transduction protein
MDENRSSTATLPEVNTSIVRDALVSRQPVYNRKLDVFAYSLLFHSREARQADGGLRPLDTAQVFYHALMDIGLEAIVGRKRALIYLTPGFMLCEDYARVFPADRVVLEVAANMPVDAHVEKTVRTLSAQGYTIALQDMLNHDRPHPLLEVADIVKIDLGDLARSFSQDRVALLRHYDVKLLAQHVETQDDFAYSTALGFDYFQGDFFCRPALAQNPQTPTNRLAILNVLAKLLHPQTEFADLEAVISRNVSLSYKLLRLVNSSFYGCPRTITSLRQALSMLGFKALTTWVSLLLLTDIDGKPHALTITATVRAKMCELLAGAMAQDGKETFFLVGLFSVLDALLDSPLPQVLAALPLADEIVRALLHHEGVWGATLHCALAYERGNWDAVNALGLDAGTITNAYLQAIAWAAEYNAVL